jgi:hypothetical protein
VALYRQGDLDDLLAEFPGLLSATPPPEVPPPLQLWPPVETTDADPDRRREKVTAAAPTLIDTVMTMLKEAPAHAPAAPPVAV